MARACPTIRTPDRTATRTVPRRAREPSVNVRPILWARIETTREPLPTVRPLTFERQLTRTRPVRAIVPATRNRRPVNFAVTFVRFVTELPPSGGTVTDASAALCGPPRPCASTNQNRTVYMPGPGAVTCAAPLAPTATAAGQML
jgi:hypothetical protein